MRNGGENGAEFSGLAVIYWSTDFWQHDGSASDKYQIWTLQCMG